jgi:RNA methyltransferase, TrmH family
MLSKSVEKYVNSLKQKKYRDLHRAFLVEGEKIILEAIRSGEEIQFVFTSDEKLALQLSNENLPAGRLHVVSHSVIEKISALSSAASVTAVMKMPEEIHLQKNISGKLHLALDGIQDPGNLGTIIRIADWFGIKNIFCSEDCADIYNQKTVQATMGSLFHISITEIPLEKLFKQFPKLSVYGASPIGKNIFKTKLKPEGFLLIGNEGHGISEDLKSFITESISIPGNGKAESLNAAVATGILCAEFFRQMK